MAATHFSGPVYSKNGFIGPAGQTQIFSQPTPASIATAGNVTYTGAQVLTGLILRDTGGANRTDVLPTAASMVTALGSAAAVGAAVDFLIVNTSAGAFTVQITMGTGGTSGGGAVLATIAQNTSRWFKLVMTNVTPGAEAYTVYA